VTGAMALTPSRPRPSLRSRAPAAGALVAQVAQALGNFVLQVLAARELGASGLGVFAFMFGALVMATAVSTGLVGDSLTVLDREDPAVRAALWRIGWLVVALSSVAALLVGGAGVSASVGVLFATAMATYMLADLTRRLLMARLRFWALAVVDFVALLAAGLVLGVSALVGEVGLGHFLAALTASQLTVILLGVRRLPRTERRRPVRGWGDWRAVMRYGTFRAIQQFVRPTALNAARWLVLVAAGTAAVGELEVARVFVAPAMLLVQGLGSYLFASYAADRGVGIARLRGRADRAALAMVGGAVVVGAGAVLVLPVLGPVLSAGEFRVSPLAALGWACYAASCAAVMPYGSLAAVRGRQLAVLVVRLVDAAVSLLLVAVFLLVVGVDPALAPWLLSVGSFLGGVLCRQVLLSERSTRADEVGAR
jgi:O-antigen/teichoic acid export membrane protein